MLKKKLTGFLADCSQLMKMRLTVVVVFSASMAYLWACNRQVDARVIWLLSIGGFFITAASNALNQVIEQKSDAMMKRTAQRPLPAGRMMTRHALLLAAIWGGLGVALLLQINALCGAFGLAALLVYVIVYTPMKRMSALAVFPGAFAGSLPVLIGAAAATGTLSTAAVLLFLFQFIWQFPHTWTIAWLQHEDYHKAGLKMLPSCQRGNLPAMLIMLSTFLIIPACLLLHMYESVGIQVAWILGLSGAGLLALSITHYRRQSRKSALALMLSCLAFLPLALIILVLEKFL